jgi:hypothetical protein
MFFKPSYFFLLSLILFTTNVVSQTLWVGMPLKEHAWRREQLKGNRDINVSFSIRPVYVKELGNFDSLHATRFESYKTANTITNGKTKLLLLPLTITQQFNSHLPYGWNDGSMIQAKGLQSQVSGGVYAKLGKISLQLRPEFVFAQNKDFPTFPAQFSDNIWKSYYNVLNRIDNPYKFGDHPYVKLFSGQSSIRFNHKKLSFGLSTENLWWGPGVRNSLLMSNNAPGFAHITFNTSSPLKTAIGSFEWQLIGGILKNSGMIPIDTSRSFDGQRLYNPKTESNRYINAMVLTWQPKWTGGLHLGISRSFYQYSSNLNSSLNSYLPVFGLFFKKKTRDENSFGRDQLLSLFFRLVFPESKTEIYGEYGRNDHSMDLRDLLLEPEHARAYIFGFRKLFDRKEDKDLELMMEVTQLQMPRTIALRAQEGWYTHYQVRHGYTNRGQVMGAGIGPGGSSQTMGLNWINGLNDFGFSLERVAWNNDFYYEAYTPLANFNRHWVDLSLNLNKGWAHEKWIYDARLSFIRTMNYQWSPTHVSRISANISLLYML